MRFMQARGASSEHAEEIAQAAWSKGWERRTQLRDDCMVGFWINAIALNEFRRGHRKEQFNVELQEICGQIGIDPAPIDAATIVRMCHPRDQILFGHQLRGLTVSEIAQELGATPTAIRIRLLRARRSARKQAESRLRPPSARPGVPHAA